MANNPTFQELFSTIKNDLKAQFGIASIIGKSVLNAFALVQTAKLKILYLISDRIYNNIFVDTADDDMILRFGQVKLNRLPFSATACIVTADVAGTIGATIPQGTTYKSSISSSVVNAIYILDSDYTFTAGTGSITLRALTLGTAGNLIAGDSLELTAPIGTVDGTANVTSAIAGQNAETIEEYRIAVIESYQVEAQGGAKSDYRIWAKDAAGIRIVYPYAISGSPGELNLFVESNPTDSADGKGTPTASQLADVESVIELDPDTTKSLDERGRRPMGAYYIYYLPIILNAVDVEITDLSDVSYLAEIKFNMETLLYNIRPYIAGADSIIAQKKGYLYISDIFKVVTETIGTNATFTAITMKVNSVAVDIYNFKDGNIPYINTVINV